MKDFLKELNELVKLHDVKALIIGLPLNMDGSEEKVLNQSVINQEL